MVLVAALLATRMLLLVFVALVLAAGLRPVVDWLRLRTPLGRGATVLVTYALFFVAVLGLALLIVPAALNQLSDLGTRLAPLLDAARAWAATIEPRPLSNSLTALINAATRHTRGLADPPDPDDVLEVGAGVADAAISVIAVLAMVFFWLTERARLQRFALALLPAERRAATREAWNAIELRLGWWVRGQLILMGSIGVMMTTAYLLIGLEEALLLGVIAALAEAIPLVGPALGAIPALIVAALTGRVEMVLLVGVAYIAIQTFESNVLVPVVMRNSIGVPAFLVVAGVLGGAAIGGIVGALIAVPLVAALLVLLERLQAREVRVPIDRADPSREPLTAESAD